LDKVPYLCVEKYDGGPFLTYPRRKEVPWVTPDVEVSLYLPHTAFEMMHPTSKEEQESFMQAWLLFGLFNEVLGDSFREEDFPVQDSGETKRIILCTKKLRPLLEAACKSRFEQKSLATKRQFGHLRECLYLVIRVSSAFYPELNWGP
jgi:hypothetical protein